MSNKICKNCNKPSKKCRCSTPDLIDEAEALLLLGIFIAEELTSELTSSDDSISDNDNSTSDTDFGGGDFGGGGSDSSW